jgi:hypothetical protein
LPFAKRSKGIAGYRRAVNSGISVALCRDLPKKNRTALERLGMTRKGHKGSLWNMRGTVHIEKKPDKKQEKPCI